MTKLKFLFFVFLFLAVFSAFPHVGFAASLWISPLSGTFSVGSTFDASIFLDTEGQSVNALEASLAFPVDKLQLVSPGTGKSIIGVWTSQPKFNNATGRIDIQGGIPGGLNVSNGLVGTLTFRVRGVGSAIVRFLDTTKVLLNDGLGTDALKRTGNGVYEFMLPPPEGPIVVSKSHPQESQWYSKSTVLLDWASAFGDIKAYSFVLNGTPVAIPDNISEGTQNRITYQNIKSGSYYFHIKSLRDGVWGGTTHFGINIDTEEPAEFPIVIIPSARTARRQPVIQFFTTDNLSGVDHSEFKLIPLTDIGKIKTSNASKNGEDQGIFIEATSPYVLSSLEDGDYDVIVRVYDRAGNFREVVKRLEIRPALFEFVADKGLQLQGSTSIPWLYVWIFAGLLLVGLVLAALRLRRWHLEHDKKLSQKEFPNHVRSQLEELKNYRAKYGKLMILFIVGLGILMSGKIAWAAETSVLAPPFISTVSRDISNEEIFYVGGRTETGETEVIIYLQNLQTGETFSETTLADKKGEWFYQHGGFLSVGNYLLWAQSSLSDELSPPTPQVQLTVRQTALQFGASRFSFETLYFRVLVLFIVVTLGLILFISFHFYHGRRKRGILIKEIREAEESLRRGFAVLRRDIEAELAFVKKLKLSRELSAEEKKREEQIYKDLETVPKYIGKEIWDIERVEHNG